MSEWASVWIKFSHPFPADGLCPNLFSAPNLHLFLPTPIRQRKSLCKSSVPKRHKIAATNSQIPGLWSLPPPEKLHLQRERRGLGQCIVACAPNMRQVWWRWERKLGWNAQFATEEMAAAWGVPYPELSSLTDFPHTKKRENLKLSLTEISGNDIANNAKVQDLTSWRWINEESG